jgi:ATP-dependent DNA helicase RecQ
LHVKEKQSLKKTCSNIVEMCNSELANQSVILYCLTPGECNNVCVELLNAGLNCIGYHGQMSAFDRESNFNKWIKGDVNVIVATKSLGMGIDKSNVRSVIHVSFPSSIPEYFQQVGRAGREMERSDCYLFFKFSDRAIHLGHISKMEDKRQSRNARHELKEIIKIFVNNYCVNKTIMKYFGEDEIFQCNMCSVCLWTFEQTDITLQTRHSILLLQGLMSKLNGKVSLNLLAKVMTGSNNKYIKDKELDLLPLYSCCKKMSIAKAEKLLVYLWVNDMFCENNGCLCPGGQSEQLLQFDFQIMMPIAK